MPVIKIIATGGTVANTRRGLIGVEELLGAIPGAREMADLQVADVCRIRSGSVQLHHWLDIARSVNQAVKDPSVDGIVVTHGTFTLEETAYFLHLATRTEKPLVFVASQRMHGEMGNDGDRNMLDAIRVALCPETRRKGVLLVLHEEIHSVREVIKTNQRPGGFISLGRGILGHVEKDQVSFYYDPLRRHTYRSEFDIQQIEELPRVDVVSAYVGADDAAARACVEAGAQGLVVNGYAFSGSPAADQKEGLARIAASGIPVVLTSRGGAGRIPVDWEDPYLQGDSLAAHKARILLMLGLTKTKDLKELQRMFNEY